MKKKISSWAVNLEERWRFIMWHYSPHHCSTTMPNSLIKCCSSLQLCVWCSRVVFSSLKAQRHSTRNHFPRSLLLGEETKALKSRESTRNEASLQSKTAFDTLNSDSKSYCLYPSSRKSDSIDYQYAWI